MKAAAAFLLGVACAHVAPAVARPLSEQQVHIRAALFRYPVPEAYLRAILRHENGQKGSEAGFNPIIAKPYPNGSNDTQAYADPTMPDGAIQQFRLARRIVISMGRWIFSNPDRRAAFMEWDAANYLNGGLRPASREDSARANYAYFRERQKIYNEERAYVDARDRDGAYNPFTWDADQK